MLNVTKAGCFCYCFRLRRGARLRVGRDLRGAPPSSTLPNGSPGGLALPTLTGTVARNLYVYNGGVIAPDSLLLTSDSSLLTVIKVLGKIEGQFEKLDNAYVDYTGGYVSVKQRPVGTMLMVR